MHNLAPIDFKERRMIGSTRNQVSDPRDVVAPAVDDTDSRNTIAILEELLGQSIGLRDLYRKARWQTADIQYHRLRQLFDRHYKEQLRLVDVLIDRIRDLGGGRQISARNFLQPTQFAIALLGNKAVGRLLNELLDAHESVLAAVRPNGSTMCVQWLHDFAVGQVVLTNRAQSVSIGEQFMNCEPRQRSLKPHVGGAALDNE
jgi:starvation-inducible DNA-binding protein